MGSGEHGIDEPSGSIECGEFLDLLLLLFLFYFCGFTVQEE